MMKGVLVKLTAVAALVSMTLVSGCATNAFPGGPTPAGGLVTNVKAPAQELTVATDKDAEPAKSGSAQATAILGLFAYGDSSVNAAMAEGGISKVHHVDHQVNSILFGLWWQTTTIVHGE